ncbi:TPA: D-alanine--D-alanine ligase, partial [Streptococcus pneumoniae]
NKKQFDIYYKEHPELGSVFVEKYIKGREFSVGILGETVLPVIEIKVKNGFYDYNNKYTVGAAEEVVPAKISEKLTHTLQKSAYKIHKALGFNVYSRTDFIVDEKGDVYFIESNSLPGMTKTSLLPQEAKAAGIDFPNLCERIIELSREIRSQ